MILLTFVLFVVILTLIFTARAIYLDRLGYNQGINPILLLTFIIIECLMIFFVIRQMIVLW